MIGEKVDINVRSCRMKRRKAKMAKIARMLAQGTV